MRLSEGKPLSKLYRKRVENNQDLIVIVDDRHNRRGTGKSTLSVGLADTFDRTDKGLTTEKASLSPDGLIKAYTEQPKGSGLVFDEAEVGASKYRAGSRTNMAVRQLVSMGRIEEKYVVINLPNSGELDRDLKALCDVWIMVEKKGVATVHFLGWNPYREHPLTPKKQTLRWTPITDDRLKEVYDKLTEEKQDRLRGDGKESQFVDRDDHQDQLEETEEQARIDTRNRLIERFYNEQDLTQEEIAEAVGLSRSRVADILR